MPDSLPHLVVSAASRGRRDVTVSVLVDGAKMLVSGSTVASARMKGIVAMVTMVV